MATAPQSESTIANLEMAGMDVSAAARIEGFRKQGERRELHLLSIVKALQVHLTAQKKGNATLRSRLLHQEEMLFATKHANNLEVSSVEAKLSQRMAQVEELQERFRGMELKTKEREHVERQKFDDIRRTSEEKYQKMKMEKRDLEQMRQQVIHV